MRHISIKMNSPVEFVEVNQINPLISKCQIKVCYVGEEPNRNGSVITKDVATKMGNSLPGSPIVGFYNEEKEDFEAHNQELILEDDAAYFKSITQPYGFVDLNAKVWFQKFLDDGIEHEYLMTEGYLWTGRYPEAKKALEQEHPQSMELDEDNTMGHWTNGDNGSPEFFIINEALISALCILGEDVEPCFEGASLVKTQFSFDDKFKNQMFKLIEEMKEILQEGGTPVEDIKENISLEASEETPTEEFALEEEKVEEEITAPEAEVETPAEEEVAEASEVVEEEAAPEVEPVQYNLEEIPEYTELSHNYSVLEAEKNSLQEQLNALNEEVSNLREFKLNVERKDKEAMIASFYMLSDEDKKNVIENIDNYTLKEIEAELSIICVRNKVSFNLEEENKPSTTFSLDASELEDECTPAWIKAVQSVAKEMN